MMSKARRYRQLPRSERQELLPAFFRLLLVRLSLFGGIRITLRVFNRRSASRADIDPAELALWQRRGLALRRSAKLLPATHCLARALALRWWMRADGLDAQLQIGIKRGSRGLESHAWVELGNVPVDETPDNVASFRVIGNESDYRRSR